MNSTLCLSLDDCVDLCVSSTQRSHIVYRDKTMKTLSSHTHNFHSNLTQLTPKNQFKKRERERRTLVCRYESDWNKTFYHCSIIKISDTGLQVRNLIIGFIKIDGDSLLLFYIKNLKKINNR